jgi:glycosyltransferase involved in cell wall biosynthesis
MKSNEKKKQNTVKKVVVVGNFNFSGGPYDGSATKTRGILSYLSKRLPKNEYIVTHYNYEYWKKNVFSFLVHFLRAVRKQNYVVLIPYSFRFYSFSTKFFSLFSKKQRKVLLPITGGWLIDYLKKKPGEIRYTNKMDGLFCETNGMVSRLKELGVHNASYMPVFSLREPVSKRQNFENSRRLLEQPTVSACSFSRISKSKGISIICQAVNELNRNELFGHEISLDLYGKMEDGYQTEIDSFVASSRGFIRLVGILPDDEVIKTLSSHLFCLFGTFFWGECFPASVLECFSAGVPVIASSWMYNPEIVTNEKTGLIFLNKDIVDLKNKILWAVSNKQKMIDMRSLCLAESEKFFPDSSMKPMIDAICESHITESVD